MKEIILLCGFAVSALLASLPAGAAPSPAKTFRAELVEPGHTDLARLRELLGKPYRRVQESAHHEFYFYDLGEGAAMDATVSVRGGIVEYVSYLCDESIAQVKSRFAGEAATSRQVQSDMHGYAGTLTQLIYDSKGRGFVFEPRSQRIRACIAWEPGKKFDELGK